MLGSEHPVVVGVDGSLAGDRALDAAADIAAHAGAPLRIISAWEMWAEDTWASASWESELPVADWARTQQNAAVRVVTKAADRARWQRAGLAVTGEVHKGPAGVALTSAHDAGLVVVGSRGLGGFSGLVLGSVSHNVIHSCDRPVMVVPASTSEPSPDRSGGIPDGLTLKEEANR